MLTGGEAAWHDRRQGHAVNVCGAVRTWLERYYQHHPHASGKAVQALLEERWGVRVSVTHLNRVRAALTRATRRGEKSARCVGGWGWWSPPVGRRSGIEPASNPANLGMWVRKRWFPVTYAHATWHRLVPFFRLPGRVTEGKQTVWVELRPFNDRQLNLTCLTDDDSASPSQEQGVSVQMVNRAKWRESLILWLK